MTTWFPIAFTFVLAAIVVGISLMYRVRVNLSDHSLWLMALPLTAAAIRGGIQPDRQIRF